MEEDAAWSDRDFKINTILEAADGTVIVQATVSGTLTGTWRSVEGRGQRVTHEHCTVFKFDDSGMITSEEALLRLPRCHGPAWRSHPSRRMTAPADRVARCLVGAVLERVTVGCASWHSVRVNRGQPE